MKIKLFASLACGMMFLASCTDDSDYSRYNTNDGVTVDMKLSTYSTRESGSIFHLPIQVNGETNGPIVVNFVSTPAEVDPAEVDVNYNVTSYHIIIPAGATEGVIEVQPIDNDEENDSRYFNITIESVDGAKVGTNPTTVVELKDNDQDPYEKMTGVWKFTAYDYFDKIGVEYTLNMVTPDPDDEEEGDLYGHELYAYGFLGMNNVFITFKDFGFDEETGEGTMLYASDEFMSYSIYPVGSLGDCVLVSTSFTGTGYGFDDLPCVFDSSYSTIEFDVPSSYGIGAGWASYPSFDMTGSFQGLFQNVKLTRP